ncbi:hypothetical protein V6N13_015730 [Hibiscus sabdariffa]|uniref:Uncharacterized protein n=1 Tax=Hibiscus sabdariffa TaxID=183260 RepID=A0ABR2CWJ7_9ROSI
MELTVKESTIVRPAGETFKGSLWNSNIDVLNPRFHVPTVTKFRCGGVCLGIGFQHTLGDAKSAVHFINSWADIARGLSPAIPPFVDRTLFHARVSPTPKFHHVEYDPSPRLKTNDDRPDDLKKSSVSAFKITVDQLNALKAKVNTSNGTKYTSFNVLAAHIWRCASKARGLSYDQPTKIHFPVDGRSKLNPPLPVGYFGNVTFIAAQITRAGDLETKPFIDTVKRIHEGLKRFWMGSSDLYGANNCPPRRHDACNSKFKQ